MPTQYTQEFKRSTVSNFENGAKIPEICQEVHISQSTLYRWIKELGTIHTPQRIYTPKEVEKSVQRLRKLEDELEIIRLSGFLSAVSLQKKLAVLEELHQQKKQFSVHELCEALDASRGTFYNHIFRRVDKTKQIMEQEQLLTQVQQVFNDSEQRFGAEKIRVVLNQNGITVSKKKVSSAMQELGLQSIRTDVKKLYEKQKQNLLKRDFKEDHPNQIWVSDITYFKLKNYGIYLCVILNLYSRRVIGYQISKHASTHLVSSTFRAAFGEREYPKGLTFHSDRGTQYVSRTFMKLLEKAGVRQSFSNSGKPHDNAVAETYFATFKKEEAYRRVYTSEESFRKSVDAYTLFYNESRPRKTLAYKTPEQFESLYWVSKKAAIQESGV